MSLILYMRHRIYNGATSSQSCWHGTKSANEQSLAKDASHHEGRIAVAIAQDHGVFSTGASDDQHAARRRPAVVP